MMSVKRITVSKLCEACDISRSTFYLYYDNVEDLTDYLERELLYHTEKILKQEQHIPFEELQNQTFTKLLQYLETHKEEFLFLNSKKSQSDFSANLCVTIERMLSNRLQFLGLQKQEYAIAITFASAGILNLIMKQITTQPTINHPELCTAYNKLLLHIFKNSA